MQAKDLRVGESFSVPACKSTMRNCVCLRHSPAGTSVFIELEERKAKDGPWKHTRDYISVTTEVKPNASKPLVNVGTYGSGITRILDENEMIGADGDVQTVEGKKPKRKSVGKKKRGRTAKPVEFPQGKFTVPSLAKKLGVSTTHIYLKITAMVEAGEAKVVEEKRAKGQRGRATKYYQLT